MITYNTEIEKIAGWPRSTHLSFAYLMSEKLLPHYTFFTGKFSFGNNEKLKMAIELILKHIFTSNTNIFEIQKSFDEVYANTPHGDDFGTAYCTYAQNACFVVLNSLKYILEGSFSHIILCSNYAIDTVDAYIVEQTNINQMSAAFEEYIDKHVLMRSEIEMQNRIIEYLTQKSVVNDIDIAHLLKLQKQQRYFELS